MALNRNFLFLQTFSILLVGAIGANILEFVATLISNDPNGYLFILAGYAILFGLIGYLIYKITYKPPKYEKMVVNSRQKEAKLIDGLKAKIGTIDDKHAKKQEKIQSKKQKAQKLPISSNNTRAGNNKPVTTSSTASKSSKPKPIHRRR